MTIIVFLVDTSASMNQRTYLGARLSVLDVAKDAVERFIKVRKTARRVSATAARSPPCPGFSRMGAPRSARGIPPAAVIATCCSLSKSRRPTSR
ncbi:hypothetical protein HPB48_007706 [Haemaphysalis longicornis]|uniref:VWFA domain-containing protein n=1 Tax=Haemaphysalis longicornis TaxID=44386 RepID=A0A9J6G3S3_HAELO|nr:hypothetical protein HPB48_007706 [Haemaphysalis longicornis]